MVLIQLLLRITPTVKSLYWRYQTIMTCSKFLTTSELGDQISSKPIVYRTIKSHTYFLYRPKLQSPVSCQDPTEVGILPQPYMEAQTLHMDTGKNIRA